MNYIRGAVNAISAPYQYYKDLPPINPSTFTGAIDVIVIQRPTSSGDTELACSPFHVRFGKWQVLRPGDKKVRAFLSHSSLNPSQSRSIGQCICQWPPYSIQYEDW
jgi:phosphatidate phosphatase LPIN